MEPLTLKKAWELYRDTVLDGNLNHPEIHKLAHASFYSGAFTMMEVFKSLTGESAETAQLEIKKLRAELKQFQKDHM